MTSQDSTKTGVTSITTAADVPAESTTPTSSTTPRTMVNGQPNPTGVGPYCAPDRCYCGGCAGYEQQRAAADQQYKRELEKARNNWKVKTR